MRLFVVTHCQATHHVEGRVGGWLDSALTGLGLRHAKALGERLRAALTGTERLPQVFSSDLRRAQETAAPIAAAIGTDVRLRRELREMGCGVAEGEPHAWVREHGRPLPRSGGLLNYRLCEGAESRLDVAERLYPFVDELIERAEPETVVVTHGGAHDILIGAWLGLSMAQLGTCRFRTVPGSVTELALDPHDGMRVIERLADDTHLRS
ncbi:MAG: histidine phosphatase family protein [Pseudomonadota bacterium]